MAKWLLGVSKAKEEMWIFHRKVLSFASEPSTATVKASRTEFSSLKAMTMEFCFELGEIPDMAHQFQWPWRPSPTTESFRPQGMKPVQGLHPVQALHQQEQEQLVLLLDPVQLRVQPVWCSGLHAYELLLFCCVERPLQSTFRWPLHWYYLIVCDLELTL